MAVSLSALRAKRPWTPWRFLILVFVSDWIDPSDILKLEGVGQLKNSMAWLRIESAAVQLVVHSLNQLRHLMSQAMVSAKLDFNLTDHWHNCKDWYYLFKTATYPASCNNLQNMLLNCCYTVYQSVNWIFILIRQKIYFNNMFLGMHR
jgi:hypothetical protein